ncbi:MAG: hypothetical protein ACFFC7_02525 [Candidatus Hermodarchaeota archaeon]
MTNENIDDDDSLKRFLESKALISGVTSPVKELKPQKDKKAPLSIDNLIPYRSLKLDTTLALGITALAKIAVQEAGENRETAIGVYNALREYDYATAQGYLREIKQGTQDVTVSALYVIKKTLEKLLSKLDTAKEVSETADKTTFL